VKGKIEFSSANVHINKQFRRPFISPLWN